jgi:hypothetical protein
MPILETMGLSWLNTAAGFVGSVISLRFVEGLNLWSRLSTVAAGTMVAAYCTPIAVELLGLSHKLEGGIAFMLGLFGMSIAGAVIKAIPQWVDSARQKWAGGEK